MLTVQDPWFAFRWAMRTFGFGVWVGAMRSICAAVVLRLTNANDGPIIVNYFSMTYRKIRPVARAACRIRDKDRQEVSHGE